VSLVSRYQRQRSFSLYPATGTLGRHNNPTTRNHSLERGPGVGFTEFYICLTMFYSIGAINHSTVIYQYKRGAGYG